MHGRETLERIEKIRKAHKAKYRANADPNPVLMVEVRVALPILGNNEKKKDFVLPVFGRQNALGEEGIWLSLPANQPAIFVPYDAVVSIVEATVDHLLVYANELPHKLLTSKK